MSYPAALAFFVSALTIVSAACFLPYLNSALRREQRPKFPVWTVVAASLALFASLTVLLGPRGSQADIIGSLGLTTALLAGLALKWLMEIAAQKKPVFHEAVLFRAMLLAPLIIALVPQLFTFRPTLPGLLLWFLHGFFCHTLCSDLARVLTREVIIIRRREPPTLPHDFRKPEVP
jgi:hypothetical protein